VPRLYVDPNRAFGGVYDDADERLAYYHRVIAAAEADCLPTKAGQTTLCCWADCLPKGS
jgi:hypothetical protein